MGLFEDLYDCFMVPTDWLGLRRWRRWAASIPGKRILEVGVGTGLNVAHFKEGCRVYGIDPNPLMLARARKRIRGTGQTRLSLAQTHGENLPFSSAAFDGVVGTLVLCTVADPKAVLLEIRRVLKPEGSVRLVEHVRMGHALGASIQDLLTPQWRRLAGGCHLNRDTLNLVEEAGFRVLAVKKGLGGLLMGIGAVVPADSGREVHATRKA